MKPTEILTDRGFNPQPLNYCTKSGKSFYLGYNKTQAGVVAMIEDESDYLLTKEDLTEISTTAKVKGITEVNLFTNFGLEIHSKHETPEIVGFNRIKKINSEGRNY